MLSPRHCRRRSMPTSKTVQRPARDENGHAPVTAMGAPPNVRSLFGSWGGGCPAPRVNDKRMIEERPAT